MLDYSKNEEILHKYVLECRERIKSQVYSEAELRDEEAIREARIDSRLNLSNDDVSDGIRKWRNKLVDIKLNHTLRVVHDVADMAQNIGANIDFKNVLKTAALLHDIARFEQATYNNCFKDNECKLFAGEQHAEYGYKMLYINGGFSKFQIPQNYHYAISQAVRYHQKSVLCGDLSLKIKNKNDLNVDCLTGGENLNDAEKLVVAALVQMVKDVDMLDIFYQHLTGEFPLTTEFVNFSVDGDSLREVCAYWGISEEKVMKFNKLQSTDISHLQKIGIPFDNVDPFKLVVADDIRNKFFKNEKINLSEIRYRRDWTFVVGMWWRLNHFLN